jgi:hypothetical protein
MCDALVALRPMPTPEQLVAHHEESYRAGRYAEIASAVPVRTALARDRLQRLRPLAPAGAGDVGQGRASGGYKSALSTFQGCRDYGPRFCGRPGIHAASKSPVTSGIPAVFETISSTRRANSSNTLVP